MVSEQVACINNQSWRGVREIQHNYSFIVDAKEFQVLEISGPGKMEMEKVRIRQQVSLDHLRPAHFPKASKDLVASVCAAGDSAAYERAAEFGDDVVIVAAYRTPICKAKRGGFKDTLADDLLAPVLKALIDKTGLNPVEVGDIVVGTVLAPGSQRASECRMAAFYAGFPETVPVRTVNRQCSSGLQAVADVAAAIKAGFYDIGIGAGVESMSVAPLAFEGSVNPKVEIFRQAQDCLLPMGITSENVAERYGVSRQDQDQAAVESHRRAAAATAAGKFKDEIIPVETKIVDPKTGDEKPVTISVDDGIRPDSSLSVLGKLKPAFKKGGSTTAGNSSQVSDGAGAVLLMKRVVAMQKGLPILGVFRSFTAVGVDPAVMGVGPAVAIPAAVKAAGLEIDDIDLFEINEAFASQFTYCSQKLELDPEKVNVNGGAIALGHPLGATGARCVATLLHEMKRRGKDCRFGVISMCIGTGMGAAAVFERSGAVDQLCNARPIKDHTSLSRDAQ
jgi:acetyl-CoA acyltransferase 1